MATFAPTAAPSNWGAERGKIDSNWDVANSFTQVLVSASFSNQAPTDLDTSQSIDFGAPTINDTNFITLTGGTDFEFKTDAVGRTFFLVIALQFGRTTGGQEAHMGAWFEINLGGGSSWNSAGNCLIQIMDNQNTSKTVYFPALFRPQVSGELYRMRMVRASTNFGFGAGTNDGGLFSYDITTENPDAANSPSAAATVYLMNEI